MFSGGDLPPTTNGCFPDEVTPFPDTFEIFSDQPTDHRWFPPRKLRPVRHNGRLLPNYPPSPSLNHQLPVIAALGGGSVSDCQSPQTTTGSFDSSSAGALGFLSLPDICDLRHELAESGAAGPFLGDDGVDVAAALQEIKAGGRVVESVISELKRRIPQVESDTTTSSSPQDDNTNDHTGLNRSRRKKRKQIECVMEDLMNQVMVRQEKMHCQLIELINKREAERIIREEEWKMREIERVKKEESIRAQEASRNLTLISYLNNAMNNIAQIPPQYSQPFGRVEEDCAAGPACSYNGDDCNAAWSKSEIEALIAFRSALDCKLRDNLSSEHIVWEELSASMAKMGYCRSGKECRQKLVSIDEHLRREMVRSERKCHETTQELEVHYSKCDGPRGSVQEVASVMGGDVDVNVVVADVANTEMDQKPAVTHVYARRKNTYSCS